MKSGYTGINIQWPISRSILDGTKTIETRHYPLPKKYENVELLIIETPGKNGAFKARIVGVITFSESIQYESESKFYKDQRFHLVDRNSPWAWKSGKIKWGWKIKMAKPFSKPVDAPKAKGIRFTNNILIQKD